MLWTIVVGVHVNSSSAVVDGGSVSSKAAELFIVAFDNVKECDSSMVQGTDYRLMERSVLDAFIPSVVLLSVRTILLVVSNVRSLSLTLCIQHVTDSLQSVCH
jgi:hypothetical protein